MFYEKRVRTPFGKYFIEVVVFRESNQFEVRVYPDPPVRKYFGVPVKKEPHILRRFYLEKPFLEAIEELVLEWERPMRYAKELKEWDGTIREEKPKSEPLPEPSQTIDPEEQEKEYVRTITDHEDPDNVTYIRVREGERIIPVRDVFNPDVRYITLKDRKEA